MTVMTGGEALIELLRREGVKYVFGIPGATEILFMEALKKHPDITYILGLNELVVAGMAEGYARASGRPGFLNLHTGPGVAASLAMLYNAHRGNVPLVITAGQQSTHLLLHDPHLSGDLIGMTRPFTKWNAELQHVEDIPLVMQRAFKMAIQPPTGPVFVSIPQNVLEDTIDYDYVPNTILYTQQRPDIKAIEKAVAILCDANTPLIMVESGVSRNKAVPEVIKLAELIGARVYQPWMADVNFPVNHNLYLGDLDPSSVKAKEIFKKADTLIMIGCPLFSEALYSPAPVMQGNTRIIQIDDNPWEIGKNIPVEYGIQGNIKESLTTLIEALKASMSTTSQKKIKGRTDEIKKEKALISEGMKKQVQKVWHNVPISVPRLMHELKESIKPSTIVVDDCWSSSEILRNYLGFSDPDSYYRARGGGSIGWGLPGALGVKLAKPERPVIAISGDGSAAWSMQSFWTAAHYKIPITFVVTANAAYRQVKIMRKVILGYGSLNEKCCGMDLDEPVIDFCELAQSMGVVSERVIQPDKLGQTIRNALAAETPRLIEVSVENPA